MHGVIDLLLIWIHQQAATSGKQAQSYSIAIHIQTSYRISPYKIHNYEDSGYTSNKYFTLLIVIKIKI